MTQPSGEQQQSGAEAQGSGNANQEPPKPGEQQQGGQQTPRTFTQEDFNRFEARIKREYRDKREADEELIEMGRQAKEALDAKRPLEERVTSLTTESAQKDSRISTLEAENRRMKLAGKANLHPDLWDRVRGTTEDEINADIEVLKQFSPQQQQQQGGGAANGAAQQGSSVTPNPQQGMPSSSENKGSVQAGRDLFKQRHGVESK